MSDHSQAAGLAAAAKGCVVVLPSPNELFIDIDSEADFVVFSLQLGILQPQVPCTWVQRPSPSGKPGRYHIVVTLPVPVTDERRILLQALLGSDRKHEMLSYLSVLRGDSNPTVFFEKAVPVPEVVSA